MAASYPDSARSADGDAAARECGLASALLGGFVLVAGAVSFVFNLLVAVHGRTVLLPYQVRLHTLGTAAVVALMLWAVGLGVRLSGRAAGARGERSGLATAGWALNVVAGALWVLFAINTAFIVASLW
jgi:hypothetical protein